jgi:putative membrane protein
MDNLLKDRVSKGMSNKEIGDNSERFEVRATAESHFSWLRTRMALERTMMAWVRTATGLIGFGFTIVQFFDVGRVYPNGSPVHFPQLPHYLGLALIFCGVAALVISIWEYRWTTHYLRGGRFAAVAGLGSGGFQTPLYAVAIALTCVGTFTFLAVLFQAF